jgi:8-oxo-dGTP diphosphatase
MVEAEIMQWPCKVCGGKGSHLGEGHLYIPDRKFTYDFARPSVTCDTVVFGRVKRRAEVLHVLLVTRKKDPFKGQLAFPGGFLDVGNGGDLKGEGLEDGALRELREETGFVPKDLLVQFGAFGRPDRDPRGRVITIGFWVNEEFEDHLPALTARDDAAEVGWHRLSHLLDGSGALLAFDHTDMLRAAYRDAHHSGIWV